MRTKPRPLYREPSVHDLFLPVLQCLAIFTCGEASRSISDAFLALTLTLLDNSYFEVLEP